jgi:hypothetical protein
MKSKAAAAAAGLAALVVVGTTLAAAPAKSGLYSGTLTGRGLEKKITLKVAPNGKTARASLYCANTLYGRLKSFPIRRGRFDAVKKTGSVTIFRLRGRFVTKRSAAVGLIMRAACDGVGGSFRLYLSS